MKESTTKSAQIVAWKRKHPRATARQMAERFGVSRQAVHQALARVGLRPYPAVVASVGEYVSPPPRFGAPLCSNVAGALAEMLVCVDLMKRGLDVYRSISPSGRCDVVAICRDSGAVNRIEVKCGTRNQAGKVTCQVGKHNSFDTLAMVVGDGEIVYEPPLP